MTTQRHFKRRPHEQKKRFWLDKDNSTMATIDVINSDRQFKQEIFPEEVLKNR